ncbi:tail fiber domain-containing protein [Mucilaginibacter calamicampi]|uniref:Tail fiber domain-containing protein n=1 Tax=Mucilaginibacter calamicampi TaxID=1302352 RepID=A0ABW2YYG5_9SPHI
MNSYIKSGFVMPVIAALFLVINTSASNAQQVSDKDIKKNATPVSNSLAALSRLEPVTYQFNREEFKQLNLPAGTQYGFIAEDVKQVLPSAVSTDAKWYTAGKNNQRAVTVSTVDLEKIVPLLVGAVKEQQAEIEKLRAEIQALKK